MNKIARIVTNITSNNLTLYDLFSVQGIAVVLPPGAQVDLLSLASDAAIAQSQSLQKVIQKNLVTVQLWLSVKGANATPYLPNSVESWIMSQDTTIALGAGANNGTIESLPSPLPLNVPVTAAVGFANNMGILDPMIGNSASVTLIVEVLDPVNMDPVTGGWLTLSDACTISVGGRLLSPNFPNAGAVTGFSSGGVSYQFPVAFSGSLGSFILTPKKPCYVVVTSSGMTHPVFGTVTNVGTGVCLNSTMLQAGTF